MMNKSAKAFIHEEENKGGQRVPLSNASGWRKRSRGDAIDEDGIKGG